MISRLFKKGHKKAPAKKAAPVKPKKTMTKPTEKKHAEPKSKKILTAEGWKRMMMRKYGSQKK